MSLTRDEIFKSDDIKRECVNIPEWGGDVWVKGLTAQEQDAYDLSNYELDENGNHDFTKPILKNVTAKMVVMIVCNDKGERIFKDDDADTLGRKSVKALNTIYKIAQRLNGTSKDAVQVAVKNSKSAPAEDLPSV